MKTKKILLIIVAIFTLIILQSSVFANELTLTISADKEKIKVEDEIKIKVSWNKAMQAADFELNYDAKKVEYIKCDIDEVYVTNDEKQGIVKTSWVSLDNTDKTEIEYTFKVKKSGKAKFTTTIDGGFATGGLEIPTKYNGGELIIKTSGNYIVIYILSIIIITIIIIFIKKLIGGNKK